MFSGLRYFNFAKESEITIKGPNYIILVNPYLLEEKINIIETLRCSEKQVL